MFGLLIIIFLYAFIVSAVGSFQLGPVNGLAINAALTSKRNAFWIAFGGTIPELLYSAIAYYVVDMFTFSDALVNKISIIGSIIIILIGSWFIYKGQKSKNKTPKEYDSNATGFCKGFLIGILNVQLILFWITVISFLSLYIPLGSFQPIHIIGLILGGMLGAFSTIMLYATIAFRKKDAITKYIKISTIDYLIGILLICLGLIQLILKIV